MGERSAESSLGRRPSSAAASGKMDEWGELQHRPADRWRDFNCFKYANGNKFAYLHKNGLFRVKKKRLFRTGAFLNYTSVSEMNKSTYKRRERVLNNFEDAPWTLSKLNWFNSNFNEGKLIFSYQFKFR